MYTFMNLTVLNSTGIYRDPVPEEMYYQRQPHPVNSWTFPVITHNPNLCSLHRIRKEKAEKDRQRDGKDNGRDKDFMDLGNGKFGVLNRAPDVSIYLAVFVFTAPTHRIQRDVIRKTWGGLVSSLPGVTVIFVLGSSPQPSTQKTLLKEHDTKHDLLIFDFVDHYENLTIKSMMMLSWVNRHCNNTTFVLKTDDDVIYNVFALLNSLEQAEQEDYEVFGNDVGHRGVFRDGSWKCPRDQYPYDLYLSYVTGPAYVLTPRAVTRIIDTSKYVPIIRLEDVYVTGVVRRIAGLKVTDLQTWVMGQPLSKVTDVKLVLGDIVGAHHYRTDNDKLDLYQQILKYQRFGNIT